MIREFKIFTSQFQEFRECLADIDKNCWVLDRGRLYRRIALTKDICIHMKVDPDRPRGILKSIHFLGPDDLTPDIKNKYDDGVSKWNGSRLPRENLELILDAKFPEKPKRKQSTHAFESECPICFDYHYDCSQQSQLHEEPETPSIVCKQCQAHFHHTCLLEWFMNLEKVKVQSFAEVQGPCPHCKSKMSIPKKNVLK